MAATLGSLGLWGAPAPARADFGVLSRAFVLPETVIARLDGASEAHLAWTLTLPELGASARPVEAPAEAPSAADHVGNVVGVFGRGFDVGKVGVADDLVQNRLLLQVRTSLGRRRVLLRCVVRFP